MVSANLLKTNELERTILEIPQLLHIVTTGYRTVDCIFIKKK